MAPDQRITKAAAVKLPLTRVAVARVGVAITGRRPKSPRRATVSTCGVQPPRPSQSTPSGGSTSRAECSQPWYSPASAATDPPLPTSEPP